MTKLRIGVRRRVFRYPGGNGIGQSRYCLFGEDGLPLPKQRDVTITQKHKEPPIVTVSFVVDGVDVAIEPGLSVDWESVAP